MLCPEAKSPAVVDLDGHFAIEACSQWPERQGCRQECVTKAVEPSFPHGDEDQADERRAGLRCGASTNSVSEPGSRAASDPPP